MRQPTGRDAARDVTRKEPEASRGAARDESGKTSRSAAPADSRQPATTAPRDTSRDAAREQASREQAPRDQGARDQAAREADSSSSSSAPDRRQPLDAGSLTAFQRGSRSGSGAFYSDAPTTAASVARITYTLEAYSDAIAKRDLEALREVRSPVTAAESSWVKDGTTTVRFSNVDVSVEGTEAVVRCRRTIASDGKTRASGAVEVRLTRKPSGWVITEIR